MEYQAHGDGYVFWSPGIKGLSFNQVDRYWEYCPEQGVWNIYRVIKGVSRRMAIYNIGEFSPVSIVVMLKDKECTVHDCDVIEKSQYRRPEKEKVTGVYWSIDFDGKSVMSLMEQWPRMPFAHIKLVIENEGGSIDSNGIIHRG